MRMSVRPFILSNINPSMATRTVAINFYLKHQWGGEKIVLLLLLLFCYYYHCQVGSELTSLRGNK